MWTNTVNEGGPSLWPAMNAAPEMDPWPGMNPTPALNPWPGMNAAPALNPWPGMNAVPEMDPWPAMDPGLLGGLGAQAPGNAGFWDTLPFRDGAADAPASTWPPAQRSRYARGRLSTEAAMGS